MLAMALAVAVYGAFAMLTAIGSRRRGNSTTHSVPDGLAWPVAWVAWFVADNRAQGRPWFQGHAGQSS